MTKRMPRTPAPIVRNLVHFGIKQRDDGRVIWKRDPDLVKGFIVTDMTDALGEQQKQSLLAQVPLGRLGSPDDVAHAVAFLASPQASYITGETLHVNGGMYMI